MPDSAPFASTHVPTHDPQQSFSHASLDLFTHDFVVVSLEFDDAEIVVRFRVIVVVHQRQPKALYRQMNVRRVLKADVDTTSFSRCASYQCHFADVVPDFRAFLVAVHTGERLEEAGNDHIVLLRMEATQGDVREHCSRGHAHL